MEKRIQILKRMEANLRLTSHINSIQDYLNLMHRYRNYIVEFNKLGYALAKRLLKGNHLRIPMSQLGIKLYLDVPNNRLVFRNESVVTFYLNQKDGLSIDQLIDLYDNRSFNVIKANIDTPLIISGQVLTQLPAAVFNQKVDCDINEIIRLLNNLRVTKLDRILEWA
ncbi:hypothetical protein [Rufibacter hautae]|uniref:Uncharacterized protein n=1 Tax=Rufibacter hautae TaxID=2595005 RepID=A0A5B6T956_9BACT|nr:hypothetical protein [Rufibacter hautae]KAA3436726.1 hypothetical protein FOA19_20320 [Rufibacter hautae]